MNYALYPIPLSSFLPMIIDILYGFTIIKHKENLLCSSSRGHSSLIFCNSLSMVLSKYWIAYFFLYYSKTNRAISSYWMSHPIMLLKEISSLLYIKYILTLLLLRTVKLRFLVCVLGPRAVKHESVITLLKSYLFWTEKKTKKNLFLKFIFLKCFQFKCHYT